MATQKRVLVVVASLACALVWNVGLATLFLFTTTTTTDETPLERKMESTILPPTPVHLLKLGELEWKDLFSATWIQPVATFLELDTNKIRSVEQSSFQVFYENSRKVRMTYDWLDFSVEHMSKWWKVLGVFDNEIAYHVAIQSFQNYVKNIRVDENDFTMKSTLAVIAFQPWTHDQKQTEANVLTVSSLAATVASLWQAGFGRVVVVGYNEHDSEQAQEAFQMIRDIRNLDKKPDRLQIPITTIGSMEVGYVRVSKQDVKTDVLEVNMPKGALVGLQRALKGELHD